MERGGLRWGRADGPGAASKQGAPTPPRWPCRGRLARSALRRPARPKPAARPPRTRHDGTTADLTVDTRRAARQARRLRPTPRSTAPRPARNSASVTGDGARALPRRGRTRSTRGNVGVPRAGHLRGRETSLRRLRSLLLTARRPPRCRRLVARLPTAGSRATPSALRAWEVPPGQWGYLPLERSREWGRVGAGGTPQRARAAPRTATGVPGAVARRVRAARGRSRSSRAPEGRAAAPPYGHRGAGSCRTPGAGRAGPARSSPRPYGAPSASARRPARAGLRVRDDQEDHRVRGDLLVRPGLLSQMRHA
ncbi:hypothetical protein SALBM217S_07879 [Streptomyces griseoloalbus]